MFPPTTLNCVPFWRYRLILQLCATFNVFTTENRFLKRLSLPPITFFVIYLFMYLLKTAMFIFSVPHAGGLAMRLMLVLLRCAHDNNSNQARRRCGKVNNHSHWTVMIKKTARSTTKRSFMHDLVVWYEQEDKWVLCKVSFVLVSHGFKPWKPGIYMPEDVLMLIFNHNDLSTQRLALARWSLCFCAIWGYKMFLKNCRNLLGGLAKPFSYS